MSEPVELHFPTQHFRWLSGPADEPVPSDGQPRVFSFDAGGRRACRLQQRWLPMVAGQGREPEWRDVPIVVESADGA